MDNKPAAQERESIMPKSPAHVNAATPLLRLITIFGGLLGAILLLGGVYLAFNGGLADTKFTLFGNEFESTSVGVSMAFIGAVLIVITFRRVLSSVDRLASLPDHEDDRKRKQSGKDRILAVTTETLNSLHKLDNAIRTTVGPLTRFDQNWLAEEREAAMKKMTILADTEKILPEVRQLVSQLQSEVDKGVKIKAEGKSAVKAVLNCGHAALDSLGHSVTTPWHGPHELAILIQAVHSARTPQEAESIRAEAEKAVAVVDRSLLREADELVGQFRAG